MSRPDEQAWRDIVDNFGDRADLGDGGPADLPEFEEHDEHEEPAVEPDPQSWTPSWADEGHFEPPAAPPVPRTSPVKTLAWLGVLGMPAVAIVLYTLTTIINWTPPGWMSLLMVAGFVGGFGVLIAGMRANPEDPWDDGARL